METEIDYTQTRGYSNNRHIRCDYEARVVEDEHGKYVKPYLIQRGEFRHSGGSAPTLSNCFVFDYMGAAEFEQGAMARRAIELSMSRTPFQVVVDGLQVWGFFNPTYFDAAGVLHVLTLLRGGPDKIRTKEWTNFDKFKSSTAQTDMWFELEGGLVWTTDSAAHKILERAIKASAELVIDARKSNAPHTA